MSRVITGLGAPPAQAASSSRPLTLSERFAAIAAQPDGTSTTAAGWQTTSYDSAPSNRSSKSPAKQHSASKHNAAQPTFSASGPILPLSTSPTKQGRPARQLKLKGGTTVSVGATDPTATSGRKQRNVLLQKEKRATALEKKRSIVKQSNGTSNGTTASNKPRQRQPQLAQQPFTFVPPPFPSAFGAVAPFTSSFMAPSAFPSAFHPGVTHPPLQQQKAAGRGGRGGVKAGAGGRVKGGGGGQQQQQQQRAGVKGKRGKAAVGTAARAVAAVGQRNDKSKGGRRKSGKGGKAGGGGGGDVTSASLDSEMDLYHAGQ